MPSEKDETELGRGLVAYVSALMEQGFTKKLAIAKARQRMAEAQETVVQERRANFKIVE